MSFLFDLFLFTTLSSMTAMDIAASLLVLNVLIFYRKELIKTVFPQSLKWILGVWVLVVGLGLLLNQAGLPVEYFKIFEFKWVLFLYVFLTSLFQLNIKEQKVKIISIWLIIASVISYYISATGDNFLKGDVSSTSFIPGVNRTGGLYGNPMMFAHAYGVFFCFVISWFFHRRSLVSGLYARLIQATVLFLGLAVFLSFTRGVWISLFLAVAAMILQYRRNLMKWIVAVGVGSAFVVAVFLEKLVRYGEMARVNLWIANLEIFKDYPMFGVGYGNNTKLLPQYYTELGLTEPLIVSHAHNQLIHLLAGTGLAGAICYFAFATWMFVIAYKVVHAVPVSQVWHRSLALGAFGSQVHFIFGGLFEANFEHAKVQYVMCIAWGVILWLYYEYISSKQQKRP